MSTTHLALCLMPVAVPCLHAHTSDPMGRRVIALIYALPRGGTVLCCTPFHGFRGFGRLR
jgi:hypothetical protein